MPKENTQVLLETERLVLRRFTADDADNLFELDSDPEVMRFLNGGQPTPRQVVETSILPRFLRYDEDMPGFGFWAAVERASGDFVGWFSFRPAGEAHPRQATLGFRLHRAAWGRGYATEGARALIRLGFTELGLERVSATTYEENLASRRVMEKAGMALRRRFRLTPADLDGIDTYHVSAPDLWDGDDVEYAIYKSAWEQQERN
jgi:RimJ/RimL family protein N-acetyltransferase